MSIVTVGIDLAKIVFAEHGVNAEGKDVLVRPIVARAKLLQLIASIPPCTIGMEACSGANYLARQFQQFGHTVKIMAAKFVAPHRVGGKNDAADAAAICTALVMPKTRFVPIKDVDQQKPSFACIGFAMGSLRSELLSSTASEGCCKSLVSCSLLRQQPFAGRRLPALRIYLAGPVCLLAIV